MTTDLNRIFCILKSRDISTSLEVSRGRDLLPVPLPELCPGPTRDVMQTPTPCFEQCAWIKLTGAQINGTNETSEKLQIDKTVYRKVYCQTGCTYSVCFLLKFPGLCIFPCSLYVTMLYWVFPPIHPSVVKQVKRCLAYAKL